MHLSLAAILVLATVMLASADFAVPIYSHHGKVSSSDCAQASLSELISQSTTSSLHFAYAAL